MYPAEYSTSTVGKSTLVHADCLEWLQHVPEGHFHAIITDPPYGVKEYEPDQLEKRANGNGGIWRIPPSFGNCTRSPLPRFTALSDKERETISHFFTLWSGLVLRALRPGGHLFIATNTFIAPLVYSALMEGGLEYRGQIIRLVRTLRGGDRPKNAESEFSNVSSMPRGCYEPWGLFRKPIPQGMKVSECLRKWGTGGLRRISDAKPFEDVIQSERTAKNEREIADHPSLKPQSFLRRLVYASLPLGQGVLLDPFMGSGSTLAAAEALGVTSVGVEKHRQYFEMARQSMPRLAQVSCPGVDETVRASVGGQRQLSLVNIV